MFIKKNNDKRILLVHPLGYQAARADRDISRLANIMAPLGLLSISAYLESHGIQTDIIDCFALPDSDDRIGEHIREHQPAYVGLTCTTSAFWDSLRIARFAKEADSGLRVVLGGPHISAMREATMRAHPEIDFCIVGEGEQALVDLIAVEDDRRMMGEIPGLIYREGSEVIFNGTRKELLDLDRLPFPAYEKLAGYPSRYQLPIFNYPRTPNTCCSSSRGCTYTCSYCDRSVFGRSFRCNSAEYLYEHVSYLKTRFGIRHINFYDDQFTFNRNRVESFCTMMTNKPLGITFNCAVRAEHVDLELLRMMKQAGCWMISLGIETGDPNLLSQHRQNADLEMLAETVRDIKKAGIRAKGLLMMGLPGESVASITRSMDYVFSLPLDDFNLAKFTPFPGAPLYDHIHELGQFDEDWEKMDCMNFVFIPKGMEKEQLEKLFLEFYKAHYKRLNVLWGYATMLWKSPDSWKRFAGNFMRFLKFAISNKRIG